MSRQTIAYIYVAILAALALLSVGTSLATLSVPDPQTLVILTIFVVLSVLAEIYATWVPAYNWEISSSIAICLASVFILGPPLAIIAVFLSSLFSELLLRFNAESSDGKAGLVPIAFNVSQLVITVTLAGGFLLIFNHAKLLLIEPIDFALAVAVFVVYLLANLSFVTGIVAITEGKRFFAALGRSIRQFIVQYLVLCVSALLLTALYSISVWHVFLALFPLTLVHVSFRGYVQLQTEARNTFERISQLLDARDHYTAVHSAEVAELAVKIGWELGLSQQEIEQIEIAARVHDIGKVAIPDSILLKPGPLNDEEWEKMHEHPVISAELIAGLEIYSSVADAVKHEHERWDGKGYPDRLEGEEIPLIARVIAAADIYNALSTDRPYRKAFGRERTTEMIQEMSGAELDPRIAEALLRVIESLSEPEPHLDSALLQSAET